jgi:hypothetical protein
MGYFLDGIQKLAWKGMLSRIPGVNSFGRGAKGFKMPKLKMPAIPKVKAIKMPRYTAASNRTNDTFLEALRRSLKG